MGVNLEKRTAHFIRDLHARERMRLGWYRQWAVNEERVQYLRERKANHSAFLKDLLRQRGLRPAWYSRPFYIAGHAFGFFTAFLPEKWATRIENTLEWWMLARYKAYFRKLKLDLNLRTMIESLELRRMSHNEPGPDVLHLLEKIIIEEEEKQVKLR